MWLSEFDSSVSENTPAGFFCAISRRMQRRQLYEDHVCVYLNTDVTVTVCNMNWGEVKNLQQKSQSTVWGVAKLPWKLPSFLWAARLFWSGHRLSCVSIYLAWRTPTVTLPLLLWPEPCAIHRRRICCEVNAISIHPSQATENFAAYFRERLCRRAPPPPRMFRITRAWLQVMPVFSRESSFSFLSLVCRFLGLYQMMKASPGSAGMTGCLINFKYIMFSQPNSCMENTVSAVNVADL